MYGGHFKNDRLTVGFASEMTSVLDVVTSSTLATMLVCESSEALGSSPICLSKNSIFQRLKMVISLSKITYFTPF